MKEATGEKSEIKHQNTGLFLKDLRLEVGQNIVYTLLDHLGNLFVLFDSVIMAYFPCKVGLESVGFCEISHA